MSVQAGIWNFDGAPVDRAFLGKISAQTAEYGPDGEALHFDENVGMLYRPFHATLESRQERQPCLFANGKVITWDGRLDNRDELISQLEHIQHGDHTDVGIVAAAFERWGSECFRKLMGDWALSLWDPTEKILILAKDPIGIRHLYYCLTPKTVLWCTHLNSLVLIPGMALTLNDEYVAGYLAYYPSASLSPYREIETVAPGTFAKIRNGRATKHPYWTFTAKKTLRYTTDAEYEEQFRFVFRQAVRRRLRSDSPILAELSGGLDSSSIVCMADDILLKGGSETSRLDTVSFYNPTEPMADERPYITTIENKRSRKGHHINLAEYGYDFFCIGSGELPTVPGPYEHLNGFRAYLFSLLKTQGYKVLLSGAGGDDLLGGWPKPHAQLADLMALPRPTKLVRQLALWSISNNRHWIRLVLGALSYVLPGLLRARFSRQARVESWIDAKFAIRNRLSVRRLGPQRIEGFWLPSRREYAQTLITMRRRFAFFPPQTLHCEEKRYPYLDLDLIDFLSSIPANQLFRPGSSRSLMRRALNQIVPKEVLLRKTKGDDPVSPVQSFRSHWPELERLFISPLSARMGYLNGSRFLDNLRGAKNGDMRSVSYLAKGLFLELWLRALTEHQVLNSLTKNNRLQRVH